MGGIFNNIYEPGKGPDSVFPPVEMSSGSSNGRDKATILPTVLKVSTEEIDYWTNMTCFYDKYWEYNPKFSTVPISFMHITSITEIITAQGAEKRVIMYEAPNTAQSGAGFTPGVGSHPAYKNNLEVIMDNVVVQPKQYQMEVIIPDSLIGPFHKQGLARLEALMQYLELSGVEGGSVNLSPRSGETSLVDAVGNILRGTQVFINSVETATSLMETILGATTGSSQMDTLNKNSIEAMASKGRVVLFKKWTGYDYSYGIITKIDISKKPTEDNIYRGSITFQETPILNISPMNPRLSTPGNAFSAFGQSFKAKATEVARYINLGMALPFIKLTGVMDEAGAPGSEDNTNNGDYWQSHKIF